MSEPQAGIVPEPNENALFLILRVPDLAQNAAEVAKAASQIPRLTAKIAKTAPRARLTSVVGFGPELWGAVSPGKRPRGFQPFEAIASAGRSAPATGGDLLVHILSRRPDLCFELSDRAKPPTARIARVVIEDEEDGEELEIVRHSFPYGTTSECGLFFIAYTRDLEIPSKMLRRMMGTSGDGLSDRLMEFSRAVCGANCFAPSVRVLRRLGSRYRAAPRFAASA